MSAKKDITDEIIVHEMVMLTNKANKHAKKEEWKEVKEILKELLYYVLVAEKNRKLAAYAKAVHDNILVIIESINEKIIKTYKEFSAQLGFLIEKENILIGRILKIEGMEKIRERRKIIKKIREKTRKRAS